jgi:CubicO group peptidase (beta-lactamase class C family)
LALITLKKEIGPILARAQKEGIFPGAVVGISGKIGGRREELILYWGKASLFPAPVAMNEDVFFDLASLTKPLATTLSVLCLMKEKKISLEESLSVLLKVPTDKRKEAISLKHLLAHSSGLPAHREYYKELIRYPVADRKEIITEWILKEELLYQPGTQSLYSDLDYILLGRIIEKNTGQSLHRFVADKIMQPLGLEKGIFFIPLTGDNNKELKEKKIFAATEECPWRHKVLCGEVHDDNAHAMGGVAGHAGLFGDMKSVLRLLTFLLAMWQDEAIHPNIRNRDLQRCMIRQRGDDKSTWALGFDTPAAKGSSSGSYLSATSVGHLGFTGTSFWMDREKDLVIVLLTNRVHPRRDNAGLKDFRPLFHDAVVKSYTRLRQETP